MGENEAAVCIGPLFKDGKNILSLDCKFTRQRWRVNLQPGLKCLSTNAGG